MWGEYIMNKPDNSVMDRHLKRVERWLKRCVAACKCGSWTDALAEAECLEAETKGLREKLWGAVEEESLGTGKRGIVYSSFMVFKVAALAMAIVLAAVMPISLDIEARSGVFDEPAESVALLTNAESDIINALRESLSNGNRGRVVLTVEIPEKASAPARETGVAMASERTRAEPERPVAEETPLPAAVAEKEDRHPSIDEVISLIQVGQRALRVSEPGVKVVPQ
jgi:hypothetical protein